MHVARMIYDEKKPASQVLLFLPSFLPACLPACLPSWAMHQGSQAARHKESARWRTTYARADKVANKAYKMRK